MKNIAIFASGSGTNAERIIKYFGAHQSISISLILTNNPKAGVLQRAAKLGVPTLIFDRHKLYHSDEILQRLERENISLIVLAGFLWLIPQNLLDAYPGKIINIHPALLPKYGGKGMYGRHVHEAVLNSGDKYSGITIHYVNEEYDEGQIIFQEKIAVSADDSPESLAQKIHGLEYEYFPRIIEKLLSPAQDQDLPSL